MGGHISTPVSKNEKTTFYFNSLPEREFENHKEIGKGAFGVVYRAMHPLIGVVAIKATTDANDILNKEKDFHYKINTHPNIVKLYGIQVNQKHEFTGLIMEYMENGTMKQLIKSEITYAQLHVLNWLRQITAAMSYLHACELLHRDLKPENLLLCRNYAQVKVGDFGLARRQNKNMTSDVGTVIYMAPELMVNHNPIQYDNKVDVFSLGITLYEILKRGELYPPEISSNAYSVYHKVKSGTRPDVTDCSESAKKLLTSMWAPIATNRPTMSEICFATNKSLGGVTADIDSFGLIPRHLGGPVNLLKDFQLEIDRSRSMTV